MLSNSTKSNPELWKDYNYFEIEKYMSQMTQNPYLSELEEELIKEKKSKIKNVLRKDLFDLLEDDFLNFRHPHTYFHAIENCDEISLK